MSVSLKKEVCVLGAGVVGLTTALMAAERGHRVVVVADKISPNTTSDVAAAVWFPYAVSPREKALQWSRTSFLRFKGYSKTEPSIVSMLEFFELFTTEVGEPWWASAVDSFRFLGSSELPAGYRSGLAAWVPVIESSRYLRFLRESLEGLGSRIVQLDGPVQSFSEVENEIIINCTGLGAARLCSDDELFPIRGQVVRVTSVPSVTRTFADDEIDDAPVYIIPRSNDCILGGTATTRDTDLSVREEDTRLILERCIRIQPQLAGATVLESKVGLRPGRTAVRLEREDRDGKTIIHNYGHGGAGYTISWGCAEHACELLRTSKKVGLFSRDCDDGNTGRNE